MKYGAMQWILGRSDDLFATAKELGLDGIELGYGERDLATTPEARARSLAQARAAGVEIPSLCIGCLNQGGWSSDDETVRSHATELVRNSIPAAVELGAKVVLVPFFFQAAPHGAEELDRVYAGFREVAAMAAAAGLILGYEGELPADELLALLDRIGSDAVQCYYDVGNAVWLGHDPLAELRQLQGRICQIHFKEYVAKLNDKPLGEGSVPVAEACDVIREIGYDGWVLLETGTFGDPPVATAKQLAYLRQFI